MIVRSPRVAADVGAGFHAAEARGLQTALHATLTSVERSRGEAVPVELLLDARREAAVVVVCRNRVVGFVPAALAPGLHAQQRRAGRRARLTAPGLLHRDGDLWRVWVGAEPDGGLPPVPDGLDTLAAPEPTIFGVTLRRTGG